MQYPPLKYQTPFPIAPGSTMIRTIARYSNFNKKANKKLEQKAKGNQNQKRVREYNHFNFNYMN